MTNKEIQTLVILELTSPSTENRPYLVEDEIIRNAIYNRFKLSKDWEYVFEPINDENKRQKYIDLFNRLDEYESSI